MTPIDPTEHAGHHGYQDESADADGPALDPDANFKAEVALYAHVDPMTTIDNLAANVGLPTGAIVHYVLARWASGGSGGLLEVGPEMVQRLWAPIEAAEATATDDARLAAYDQLRQMISWLYYPLANPEEAGY